MTRALVALSAALWAVAGFAQESKTLSGGVPPQLRFRLGGSGSLNPTWQRSYIELGATYDHRLDPSLALTVDVGIGGFGDAFVMTPGVGVRGFFVARPNGLFAYWFALGVIGLNFYQRAAGDVAFGARGGAGVGIYLTQRIGLSGECSVDLGLQFPVYRPAQPWSNVHVNFGLNVKL